MMMADKRIKVLRYLCVIVSIAAKFVSGSVLSFNLYQDALKYTFNYTQTEVEVLSSMLATGLGLGIIPGMMYDKYGSTITNVVGFVISVLAYLLLWSSVKFINFYSSRPWIIAIYFFLAGFGSSFPYMVAFAAGVASVPQRHSGTISCIQNAALTSAPALNALVYYKYFNTDVESNSPHAFSSYMLFMAILIGIVDFLCILFLRAVTDPSETTSPSLTGRHLKLYKSTVDTKETNAVADDQSETDRHIFPYSSDNMSLKELLCNPDFQIFSLIFALTTSVIWTDFSNITVLSKSVHLHMYNKVLMLFYSIVNPLVCVLSGLLSDHFKEKVPRLCFVLLGCVLIAICQIVSIFVAYLIIGLFAILFLIAFSEGIIWSLSPVIMKEMFSAKQIGRNWGITLFLSSVLIFVGQTIFGLFYDAHVKEGRDKHCYGMECTQSTNIVFLGVCVVATGIGLFMLIRTYCRLYKNLSISLFQ